MQNAEKGGGKTSLLPFLYDSMRPAYRAANSNGAEDISCETAASCGARAILLSDPRKFDVSLLKGVTTVGVSSGASAPEELVSELLEILKREKFELVKS